MDTHLMSCPCGADKKFNECCDLFLSSKQLPPTPEALMRSRYSAFSLNKMDYIEQTTDPDTRAQIDWVSNREWAKNAKFTKLEVLKSSENGSGGSVEFKAHFIYNGEPHIHHELSSFRKYQGAWYFSNGIMVS